MADSSRRRKSVGNNLYGHVCHRVTPRRRVVAASPAGSDRHLKMNRGRRGEIGYACDFIGYWLDRLIFYNAPPWVFTAVYLTFGMLVLLTLWFIPVRRPAFLIQMRR